MKNLNPRNARQVALKYFGSFKDKEEGKFNVVHTKAVVEISRMLGKRLRASVDDLVASAWVHDIGKIVQLADHAKYSIEILDKEGLLINEIMKDCIANHGTGSVAVTREGKIIQAADKLSILSIPILELLLEQKQILDSDIEFISKMTKSSIEHLRNIDEI